MEAYPTISWHAKDFTFAQIKISNSKSWRGLMRGNYVFNNFNITFWLRFFTGESVIWAIFSILNKIKWQEQSAPSPAIFVSSFYKYFTTLCVVISPRWNGFFHVILNTLKVFRLYTKVTSLKCFCYVSGQNQ